MFYILNHKSGIALQFAQQPVLPLLLTSEYNFVIKELNTRVNFEANAAGDIIGLTVIQEGNTISAQRQ